MRTKIREFEKFETVENEKGLPTSYDVVLGQNNLQRYLNILQDSNSLLHFFETSLSAVKK